MLYETINPHGGDFYGKSVKLDFSANINPLGTPLSVCKAVEESIGKLCLYPDPYCRELIRSIAEYEQVSEKQILCGNGAAELIYSFCETVRPETALLLVPTFSEYATALEAVGCHIEQYLLSKENDFTLTKDFLSTLKQYRPDVIFLCNPNNPTGRLIAPDLLEAFAETCDRLGIRIFLDECFMDLTDEEEQYSMKRRLSDYSGLFILKAFTKSYGMAGLRLGYGLSDDKELLKAMSSKVQPWNISLPAQMAGTAALKETEFLCNSRRLIREQRIIMTEILKELGFYVCPASANYLLLYHRLPMTELLSEHNIMVRDCSNYHGLSKGWFRIAVRCEEENTVLIDTIRKITEEN